MTINNHKYVFVYKLRLYGYYFDVQLLDFFSEAADVQMCVALACALRQHIEIPERTPFRRMPTDGTEPRAASERSR